jgi:phospholipase C
MRTLQPLLGVLIVGASGCVPQPGARDSLPFQSPSFVRGAAPGQLLGDGKIKHVVIIVQENRSTDDLFHGLPGADTARYGVDSAGRRVPLQPISLTAPYDLDHEHQAFEIEFNQGRLDAFNLEASSECKTTSGCPALDKRAYGYVPRSEVQPYFTMAKEYAFADRMFQTNSGPSFPAHQYIISGTSTIEEGSSLRAAEEPMRRGQQFSLAGGCDSPRGTLVSLIDQYGAETQEKFPCFDRPALSDLVEAKSLSWRYYQIHLGSGPWNAPDAIRHVRDSPEFSTDVVAPPSRVLNDIAKGALATVVWVTPTARESDHAGKTDGSGPSWVASVVNAIGESPYWRHTVIFVTWDDWGGWYDHVSPPQYNAYELGFRVPLIAISPYSKKHYVSHRQHEFGSILKFVEKTFDLGSLGATDVRSDDLSDCFNFSQSPRHFKMIPAPLPPSYFLNQPISTELPDDE